jgi:bis(5'-nucleosidyl)-tetraphosphatase
MKVKTKEMVQHNSKMTVHELACGIFPVGFFKKRMKVLLIRQGSSLNKSFWGFPKGHVEDLEEHIQTAVRELKEETNLSIMSLLNQEPFEDIYSFIKDGVMHQKQVLYFLARVDDKDSVRINEECVDYSWVSLEKVASQLSYETTRNTWLKALSILL